MKIPFVIFGVVIGMAMLPLRSDAQSYWVLKYNGVVTSTNGAGKLVTTPMTDRTLIQNCAQHAGLTDTSDLALVLHVNATSVGDALEVVNKNDPNVFHCEVSQLAFPVSYTNSSGTVIKTFSYVYNNDSDIFADPSAHSRGSAVVTRTVTGAQGATRTAITGKLQFWLGQWIENAPAPQASICSGTFTSTGTLNIP